MRRETELVLLALSLAACDRVDRSQSPPPTTGSRDLHAATRAVPASAPVPGSLMRIGPYALIRDSATLARLWPPGRGPAPSVDFGASSLLAVRVFAGVVDTLAAPRVIARGGVTWVEIGAGHGPLHATTNDQVMFYRIPLDGGQVRRVTYASAGEIRP